MLLRRIFLPLSDGCQFAFLLYLNLVNENVYFSVIISLFIFGALLCCIPQFIRIKNLDFWLIYIGYAIKFTSIWFSNQQKSYYLNNVIIVIQFYLQENGNLTFKMLIIASMILNLFTFDNLIDDYYVLMIQVIQIVICFFWSCFRYINTKKMIIQSEKNLPQLSTLTANYPLESVKQNHIYQSNTQSARIPQRKQSSIILNEKFHLIETHIHLNEIITSEQDEGIAIDILLEQDVIYFQNKTSCISTLKSLLNDLTDDQEIICTFDDNEFLKLQDIILNVCRNTNEEEILYIIQVNYVPLSCLKTTNESMNLDICRSLSHELGTNLNGIITFLKMALNDESIQNEIKEQYLRPANINSEQLNLIVGMLRDYNLIQLNQFSLKVEKVDLKQEINFMITLLNHSIENKKLKLDCTFDLIHSNLVTDRIRFRQILFQLLQNAVKFTYQSSISIFICNKANECIISISDKGIGMTDTEAENLNSLLQQGKFVKVSQNSVGMGLGLGISNQLAKKMNDFDTPIKLQKWIGGCSFNFCVKNYSLEYSNSSFQHLHSLQKQGSETIMFLSFRSGQEDTVKEYRRNSIPKAYISGVVPMRSTNQIFNPINVRMSYSPMPRMRSDEDITTLLQPPILIPKLQQSIVQCSINSQCCSRVLIVDDEYFNIQCLKLILKQYQAYCDSAFNGQEALNLVEQKSQNPCSICGNKFYSVIFLDVNMPILDGYQTASELKKLMEQKIINKAWCIANTGFCDLETEMKSYDSGIDYFLTKPLDQVKLRDILQQKFPSLDPLS